MTSKRAQAALEFLSTYGFAFLIILVMVGALTYFGVLRPDRLIPNRCTFPADVNCYEYQMVSTGAGADLNIVLRNTLGNTIEFNQTSGAANSTFGNGPCTSTPTQVIGGGQTTFTCNLVGTFPGTGEKVKTLVSLGYRELGRTYWVPIQGEILTTLQ